MDILLLLSGLFLAQAGEPNHSAEEHLRSTDWASAEVETALLVSQYLQTDTTNPPGNESAGVDFLESILEAEGIDGPLDHPVDVAHVRIGVLVELAQELLHPRVLRQLGHRRLVLRLLRHPRRLERLLRHPPLRVLRDREGVLRLRLEVGGDAPEIHGVAQSAHADEVRRVSAAKVEPEAKIHSWMQRAAWMSRR